MLPQVLLQSCWALSKQLSRTSLFISISPVIRVLIVGAGKSELASKPDPKVNGINRGGFLSKVGSCSPVIAR